MVAGAGDGIAMCPAGEELARKGWRRKRSPTTLKKEVIGRMIGRESTQFCSRTHESNVSDIVRNDGERAMRDNSPILKGFVS
jgi:ribosomal protein S3AE